MAGSVQAALAELLDVARPANPTSLDQVRGTLGRGDPARLARADLGIDQGARLPAVGTSERMRYNTLKRGYERYAKADGQTRGTRRPNPDIVRGLLAEAARQTEAAWRRALAGTIARMRNDGFGLRIGGWVKVSRAKRYHVMPSPKGGLPTFDRIPPTLATPVANAWSDGDRTEAAAIALGAFFDVYWPGQLGALDSIEMAEAAW